jgi:hypothetical protein
MLNRDTANSEVTSTNFNFLRSITESKFYVLIYLRSQSKSLKPVCPCVPITKISKSPWLTRSGITLSGRQNQAELRQSFSVNISLIVFQKSHQLMFHGHRCFLHIMATVSTTWIKVYFAAVPPNSKALFSATSSALEKSTETAIFFFCITFWLWKRSFRLWGDCETYL